MHPLMNLSRFLVPALFSSVVIMADDYPGALEKAGLSHDRGSGAFNYSWWGVDGRTYFIEHTNGARDAGRLDLFAGHRKR